jgi:hypothetical protein
MITTGMSGMVLEEGEGGMGGAIGVDQMDELAQVMLMQQELTLMQRQLLAHKAAIRLRLSQGERVERLGSRPSTSGTNDMVPVHPQQQEGRRWQVHQQELCRGEEQVKGQEQDVELSAAQLVEPHEGAVAAAPHVALETVGGAVEGHPLIPQNQTTAGDGPEAANKSAKKGFKQLFRRKSSRKDMT